MGKEQICFAKPQIDFGDTAQPFFHHEGGDRPNTIMWHLPSHFIIHCNFNPTESNNEDFKFDYRTEIAKKDLEVTVLFPRKTVEGTQKGGKLVTKDHGQKSKISVLQLMSTKASSRLSNNKIPSLSHMQSSKLLSPLQKFIPKKIGFIKQPYQKCS